MRNRKLSCIVFLALLLSPLTTNASEMGSLTIYEDVGSMPAELSQLQEMLWSGETPIELPADTEAIILTFAGPQAGGLVWVENAAGGRSLVEVLPSTGTLQLGLVDSQGIRRIELPKDGSLPLVSLSFGRIFPVSDAGVDRTVPLGSTIALDGSASYDPDGSTTLNYRWEWVDRPIGSDIALSDPTAVAPTFMPNQIGDYVLELWVTDIYGLVSASDTVSITIFNSSPVAEAGQDRTVLLGSEVTLDGSGSSDPEGNPLTYSWSIVDQPCESLATLTNATSFNPSFVPDYPGSYVIELFVRDSFGLESLPDMVTITASNNSQPVAKAGPDQTVHPGRTAVLDGSASSDPDGDSLSYSWVLLTAPSGSSATISDTLVCNPTFRPDLPGSYVIQLAVTDSFGLESQPDNMTISTSNSKPSAEAGQDLAITVIGTTVELNGTLSRDPDNDDLTYRWTLLYRPPESTAQLTEADSASPSFVADEHGDYLVQLVVSDPWNATDSDVVKVSFNNVKPVADAESSTSGIVDDLVSLDGTASSDANGDALTHRWSLVSLPPGSRARLADPASAATTFTPDRPGTYIAQLVVNDGFENSNPSTTTIQVVSERSAIIQAIQELQAEITSLAPRAFRQAIMKRLLNLELSVILEGVERGRYRIALNLLRNEVLPVTDGCVVRGVPDRQDWIVDCAAQRKVYSKLQEIVAMLRDLL